MPGTFQRISLYTEGFGDRRMDSQVRYSKEEKKDAITENLYGDNFPP
jgi:hypothetical protein